MQLDNNHKKRAIHHIWHITIVCILLSGLPLEGCFENTSLPFSKSSAIKPATVKPRHIDKLPLLTREDGEKVKEDILLESPREEPFREATDRLNTHTNDISKTTIVNNVRDHSEKPKLLSKRDIEAQQKLAREERENQLKDQKKLEAKTFKTRQGGYTIKFYQKEGNWTAKVTHENIKPMDLVAILDEEAISRLVNVNPIKNHLRVILPTVDKEGFVVYDTGFGGMKRKKTPLENPNPSNNSASSAPSQPSDIATTTTSITTTPQASTSTSNTPSSPDTESETTPKSPASSPIKKKAKKTTPLSSQEQIAEDIAKITQLAQEIGKRADQLKNTERAYKERAFQALLVLQQNISESLKFLSDEKDNNPKETSESLEYYKELVEQEDAKALYKVGRRNYMRWEETKNEEDLAEAIIWLNKAKDEPNSEDTLKLLQEIKKEIQEIFKQQEEEIRSILEEEFDLESHVQIEEDNDDPLTTADYYEAVTSIKENRKKDLDIVRVPRNPRNLFPKTYKIDEKIFKIRDVSGVDNRCFFNAAGLDIKEQIQNLRSNKNNYIVRYMIANEIATDRANISKEILDIIDYDQYKREDEYISKFRIWRNIGMSVGIDESELPSHLHRATLDKREEKALNKLHLRSFSLKAFEAFIKHHIEKGKMMEMMHNVEGDDPDRRDRNYTSIDAIGYINKLGIKIYQANPKKAGELIMIRQFIPADATKVVYIYYDPAIVHFQIFIPVEPSDEGEDESIDEKETSQEQPKAKTQIEDGKLLYELALKSREEKDLEKTFEYALRAVNKGHAEAKQLVAELQKEGESLFQKATDLEKESEKLKSTKKEESIKKFNEAINVYKQSAYLGCIKAQKQLERLRDTEKYISSDEVVESRLEQVIKIAKTRSDTFLRANGELKLHDLIVMKLDLQKAPKKIVWGGSVPRYNIYESLFPVPNLEEYEDTVMAIDLAQKGGDETGYCVVKRYKDYYFIMEIGGLGGDYISNKEHRLPGRTEMLDKIVEIVRRHQVNHIYVETNIDATYPLKLQEHLEAKSISAEVIGHHQIREVEDASSIAHNEFLNRITGNEPKEYEEGKEKRIVECLSPLLQAHQLIISQDALIADINSETKGNLNYKFFYQLKMIKMSLKEQSTSTKTTPAPTEKASKYTKDIKLQHDDRIDAVAQAIDYLKKKRKEEEELKNRQKQKEEDIKHLEDLATRIPSKNLKLANMFRRGVEVQKDPQRANAYYLDYLKRTPAPKSPSSDYFEAIGEVGWFMLKYSANDQQKGEGKAKLEEAATKNYAPAQYKLAKLYEKENKKQEATKYYQEASKLRISIKLEDEAVTKAKYKLAIIYLQEDLKEEALKLLEEAAEKGYTLAQLRLGELYKKEKNFEQSLSYYEQAAKLYNLEQLYNIKKESLKTSKKTAQRKSEAYYKMASIYYKIPYVMDYYNAKRNLLEYLFYEENHHSKRYKEACYRLAKIYLTAQGGLKAPDLDLALIYFKKAQGLAKKEDKLKQFKEQIERKKAKMAA